MNKHLPIVVILLLFQIGVWAQIKKELPVAEMEIPTKACVGESIQFTNKSNTKTVHWFFGDGFDTFSENPKHIYFEAGTYTIKIQAILDARFSTVEKLIEILPSPDLILNYNRTASNDTVRMWVGQNVTATVEATSAEYALSDYKWYRFTSDEWQQQKQGDPSFTTNTKGNYKVWSRTTEGCFSEVPFFIVNTERPDDIIYTTIIVENNIATPNNDGINDVLFVKYLDDPDIYTKPLLLSIYNKQGVLIYQNADYKNNWNAQNSSGADVSTGTYYFVAQSEGRRGKTGYIDVIRAE